MGRRKPTTEKRHGSLAQADQVVWSKDFKQPVKIKSVSYVLHLDNGHDEVYREGEEPEIVTERIEL